MKRSRTLNAFRLVSNGVMCWRATTVISRSHFLVLGLAAVMIGRVHPLGTNARVDPFG